MREIKGYYSSGTSVGILIIDEILCAILTPILFYIVSYILFHDKCSLVVPTCIGIAIGFILSRTRILGRILFAPIIGPIVYTLFSIIETALIYFFIPYRNWLSETYQIIAITIAAFLFIFLLHYRAIEGEAGGWTFYEK